MARHVLMSTRKDLGDVNRRQVLADIMFNGPLARAEIAKRVTLTQASVSRITKELLEHDLIYESSQASHNRVGRPSVKLAVNPGGGYVIGVAINLFKQIVSVANLANETLASRILTPADITDPDLVLGGVVGAVKGLLQETGIAKEQVLSCGVAVTGAVDPGTGTVRSAPSIGWGSVPIGSYLKDSLHLPVYVETVPNAKNLAEYGYGKTRNYRHVVLLNAYHIIGASFLLNGELYRGFNAHAGVIENAPLSAGQTEGPAHELVSGKAVLRSYYGEEGLPDRLSASGSVFNLIDKANGGERRAVAAFEKAASAVAQLMKLVKEMLHPEVILLTGPVVACESYVARVRADLKAHAGEAWLDAHFKTSRISSEFAAQSLALYKSISEDLWQEPALAV